MCVGILNFNSSDIACRKGIQLTNIILTNNLTLLYFSIISQDTIILFCLVVLALPLTDELLNFATSFLYSSPSILKHD